MLQHPLPVDSTRTAPQPPSYDSEAPSKKKQAWPHPHAPPAPYNPGTVRLKIRSMTSYHSTWLAFTHPMLLQWGTSYDG